MPSLPPNQQRQSTDLMTRFSIPGELSSDPHTYKKGGQRSGGLKVRVKTDGRADMTDFISFLGISVSKVVITVLRHTDIPA